MLRVKAGRSDFGPACDERRWAHRAGGERADVSRRCWPAAPNDKDSANRREARSRPRELELETRHQISSEQPHKGTVIADERRAQARLRGASTPHRRALRS